jgi:hypothetical protein
MSDNNEYQKRRLKALRTLFAVSAVTTTLTGLSGMFVATNLDDGERFDLHQYVPDKVEEALEHNPRNNENILYAKGNAMADEMEGKMRLAGVLFTLVSAGLTGFVYSGLRRAEKDAKDNDNGPKPPSP